MRRILTIGLSMALLIMWTIACQSSNVVTDVAIKLTPTQNIQSLPEALDAEVERERTPENDSSQEIISDNASKPSTHTPSPTNTPVPPLPTPSPTRTVTPTPQLPACLPPEKPSEVLEPLWVFDIYDQARASGNLPSEGSGAQWQMSYNNKVLLMSWEQSSDVFDLAAYDVDTQSFRIIAHLRDLLWKASPVSDCIIVLGEILEKELKYSSLANDLVMIDSKGQPYKFDIQPDQIEPKFVSDLTWSPDGLEIAVIIVDRPFSQMGLFIIGVDGSEVKAILSEEITPGAIAWAPTGDQIALSGSYIGEDNSKKRGVLLIQVETGQQEWIVEDSVNSANSIFWSSDGGYLYYSIRPASVCHRLELATKETSKADDAFCRPYAPPGTRP